MHVLNISFHRPFKILTELLLCIPQDPPPEAPEVTSEDLEPAPAPAAISPKEEKKLKEKEKKEEEKRKKDEEKRRKVCFTID